MRAFRPLIWGTLITLITFKPLQAGVLSNWASWWRGACARHLISSDPYQFEDAPDWFIQREIARLEAMLAWIGGLSPADRSTLDVLRRELKTRSALRGELEPDNDNSFFR